jgi:lambda family phage minor tail protein L
MVRGKLLLEAVSLNPTAVIDLFQLDLRPVGAVLTGNWNGVLYFHSGNQINRTDIIFQGVEYAQWPVDTKGFEWSTAATQPRPQVTFSNVLGPFTQMNLQYGGLVNAKLTRIRTFAKFLDGMPEADSSAYFPPESWVINRKVQEDREVCVYELANPMDVEDISLPRRIVLADQCRWLYRGDGCGYTGTALFDINNFPLTDPNFGNYRGAWQAGVAYWYGDVVTTEWEYVSGVWVPQWFVSQYPSTGQQPPATGDSNYWKRDECSLNLYGCIARFGGQISQYGGWLPFGGFPGVQLQPIQLGA